MKIAADDGDDAQRVVARRGAGDRQAVGEGRVRDEHARIQAGEDGRHPATTAATADATKAQPLRRACTSTVAGDERADAERGG